MSMKVMKVMKEESLSFGYRAEEHGAADCAAKVLAASAASIGIRSSFMHYRQAHGAERVLAYRCLRGRGRQGLPARYICLESVPIGGPEMSAPCS